MDFISPSEWGATVNYDAWSDRSVIKDSVAIHWGGTPQPNSHMGVEAEKAILRAWERFHIENRGWRGIAYGYAVGMSGTVYRLRGSNNYGAHLGDQDNDGVSNNKEMIPIVLIKGEDSEMTPEAWLGVRALYQWLLQQSWTEAELPVFGHRQVQPSKPTQCPGDEIMVGITKGWVQMPVRTVVERVQDLEVAAEEAARFRDAATATALGLDLALTEVSRRLTFTERELEVFKADANEAIDAVMGAAFSAKAEFARLAVQLAEGFRALAEDLEGE